MIPQTYKKLLEMGILQAYAAGKEIEYRVTSGKWVALEGNASFTSDPNNYRIKPEPQFEVGDLVQVTGTKTVYRITKFRDNIIYGTTVDSRMPNHFYAGDLTKVHEVRIPFTFEEAVKACAEHGLMICERGSKIPYQIIELDTIDCTTVTPGKGKETAYVITYQHASVRRFTFLDNTPFCSISYEPTPTN